MLNLFKLGFIKSISLKPSLLVFLLRCKIAKSILRIYLPERIIYFTFTMEMSHTKYKQNLF